MGVKFVYIKYDGKCFSFVEDKPNGSPGSGESIRVKPGEKIKWRALRPHIKLNPFNGFEVKFETTTPTNGKSTYSSTPDTQGSPNHGAESNSVDENFDTHKYRVTLNPPNGPSIDPEVEVVDPGMVQIFYSLRIERGESGGTLICPNETVFEGDLVRVVLDEQGFEPIHFDVDFAPTNAVYLPTGKDKRLGNSPGALSTFYCQVQPVQTTRDFKYTVTIPGMSMSGSGVLIVRPRSDSGSLAV